MGQQLGFGIAAVLALASLASAQQMSVPREMEIGDDVTIGYTDAARAGQTIYVTIAVSLPEISVIEIPIHLDQKGNGEVSWTVPDALGVTFNAPGCRQITRML
mgnify:CR=1 FL=1